jgi:DNA-binding transcriptional ArsR family regulator
MKCIRVLADVNQIKQCKEDLSKVETQTRSISKVLGLAGNEVRLKMLYLIYQEGELCPCDLSDILNMSVPAVSQHLRKLKDGGLVKDKKVGQTVFYSVIDENTLIIRPILKNLVRITQKVICKRQMTP